MFVTEAGFLKAVEGVDITIRKGECAALVGESGCGKSVTGLALMRLLQTPPALYTAQKILFFDGERATDLQTATEAEMLNVRGRKISMIFQDPSAALNPVMTVGRQIDEIIIRHYGLNKKEARSRTVGLLRSVGVPDPERRYFSFPHEMSGGLKQRVLIAIATACRPALMIADEPTTALDVTIQAQILRLLRDLQRENNMALLLITHDLGVVSHMADSVYVMYLGKIMEEGTTAEIIGAPLHPYTQGLIKAVPSLDDDSAVPLQQIPHNVPNPMKKPSGCSFHPRCAFCTGLCRAKMPPLIEYGGGRKVRCWRYIPDSSANGGGDD
ncbi:MAG: ABC transporter ATP-binding protein [Clostridiales bacterium]|nr:ABC transporter ATP-binding protein [Clostridiales bacterium]